MRVRLSPLSFVNRITAAIILVYPDDINTDAFGSNLWKCHFEPLLSGFHDLSDAMVANPKGPNQIKHVDAILGLTSIACLILINYRVAFQVAMNTA